MTDFYIREENKQEWMMREFGSWEDSETDNHVWKVLRDSPKNKVRIENENDAELIRRSARYQSDIRDPGNEKGVKASKAIGKFVNIEI